MRPTLALEVSIEWHKGITKMALPTGSTVARRQHFWDPLLPNLAKVEHNTHVSQSFFSSRL